MKYGFLLLLQLWTIRALAQTTSQFTGIVHDQNRKPLPDVTVRVLHSERGARTDAGGRFFLDSLRGNVRLCFSKSGFRPDTVTVDPARTALLEITLYPPGKFLEEVTVSGSDDDRQNARSWKILGQKLLPSASSSFESLLKSLPGVSPNNELTSRYAVRGGNFDENLLYVNDVEIHQPVLIRNGQQEGLGFVNPELAGSARFSAGGFEARYGDKMSSVLDVTYTRPDSSGVAVSAGIPGSSVSVKHLARNGRSYLLAGFRQKDNRSVLSTQNTSGTYLPRFYDFQVLYDHQISRKLSVSYFGIYNFSRFRLIPRDRESEFGTSSEVYRLEVVFEGQEELKYRTMLNAMTLRYRPFEKFHLKWIQSVFQANEREGVDLLSRYLLRKQGPEGGAAGVGSQQRQRSASLESSIYASEIKAYYQKSRFFMEGGLKYQYEDIRDRYLEEVLIDSAANAVPYTPAFSVEEHYSAAHDIGRSRWSAYLQNAVILARGLRFTGGMRVQYASARPEWLLSPRVQLSFVPAGDPEMVYRLAAGIYSQPPFYREMLYADGTLAEHQAAQRSAHIVGGLDRRLSRFPRPLKLSAEVYYKQLSRLVPYKVEDLQLRYLPGQTSHGYATGLDLSLSGELVADLESAFRLSVMKSAEDIDGDFYMRRDAAGNPYRYEPGYLKRPTDQRVNMAVSFQDRLFSNPSYKVHLSMLYGGALPAGPPGEDRHLDMFRIPAYKRADIGFSRDWIPVGAGALRLHSLVLYAGVFNLFGNQNTASFLWIKDINDNQFAVPNHLTGRMLHVRVIGRFH